jgi:molybdopterin converting factor small subunit
MKLDGRRGTMGYVVTVRYFAAARAAAGLTEERTESGTLADLVARLSADHGDGLARVLGVASFLVDGVAWHDRDAALPAGATVDVLPPFAGG